MPFQLMSNQLNLPQVDSNQVVDLKHNQWKHDAPELNFEYHGKGCENLHLVILFYINLLKFQTNFFHVVIMRYCLYNFEENKEFNTFWNKAVAKQNVEKVKCCHYFPDALYLECSVCLVVYHYTYYAVP